MFCCMSVCVLAQPLLKSIWLMDLFPDITGEEMSNLKCIVDLMDEKIFIPIIEAEDKESAIKEKLEQYTSYLSLAFTPISQKVIKRSKSPEFLLKICEYLREEVKEKVSDMYTRMLLFKVINVCEEHDNYITKLLPNFDQLILLFESVGAKEYFHAFASTSLALTVTMMSIDREPKAVRSLSLVAKKFSDELELFVANFQISIEPELASLREKTSEEEVKKAKELRGSMLEL